MHGLLSFCRIAGLVLLTSSAAAAQGIDLTLFMGGAFPVYDERLTLRPSVPSLPGVAVTVAGTPELRADGGLVFGGALAFELGVLAIEGRVDSTELGVDMTGVRFDLHGTAPPLDGLTASAVVGDGRFDADRFHLLSLNARIRTPGSVSLVASGGLSYLPDVTITGSAPVAVEILGVPISGTEPRLRLRAAPGEADNRIGVNGGAGLRIGGKRVAFMTEVRVFYFREFELRFDIENAPQLVREVLDSLDPVRFEPVIVNAQAGLVFKF